ncbi:MAG: glycosyltransferase family 4 protein [Phycisphaerae bacterium]|nr:glycosyltransferase family 4 protein [Phycisphaerae bacterium]
MNLCLISREFPPFHGGGIATYTLQWARALVAQGHRPVVITISDTGAEAREEMDGFTVVRLPFIRGNDWSGPHPSIATPEHVAAFRAFSPVAVFAALAARRVVELHAEFAFDAVEVPDTGALGWFLLNARRTLGWWHDSPVPIIATIHSPTEWIAFGNRSPLATRQDRALARMEQDCIALADGLVCPSDALAQWCQRHWSLPHRAIEVVPYALGSLERHADAILAQPPVPATLPIADRPPGDPSVSSSPASPIRFLYIGRLEPRKGIDTLLAGFAIACARGLDLELDLVGEDIWHPETAGPFGAACVERLIPPSARARIRLHGKVTPDRLASLRANARAVLIPSPTDNFPFTCVEAMAEGRLVVAARAGGMAEMIRENVEGVMFTPASAEQAANALHRAAAMSPDAVVRMGRAAAARIRDYCGNARVVARRLEHLERARAARLSRLAPPRPTRPVVVINSPSKPPDGFDRLVQTVAQGHADFAHGWTRPAPDAAAVFDTPSLEGLADGARTIGPMVVSADAATSITARVRTTPTDAPTEVAVATSPSTWAVAVELVASGRTGVVIPEVVCPVPAPELDPAETEAASAPARHRLADAERARDAALAELRTIHASRGWRWLQRVYRLLRLIRHGRR